MEGPRSGGRASPCPRNSPPSGDPHAACRPPQVRTYFRMIVVCVLIPRFALTTALGDPAELLPSPVAHAPEPGGTQQVGEVSMAAEAFGIHRGMRLGEALARCPEL